jgi:outer membrane protein assembly factor BamA
MNRIFMRKNPFFTPTVLLLFCLACLPLLAADVEAAPVISRITIRGTDIFDFETKPNLNKFPYSWINLLHFQTKEYVVRQELLFSVGDRLDVFLLRETERNLRALSFIRSARVVGFPQRDGTVVLVVHVNDSWTTEPQVNLSGVDGVDKLEIGFKEKNFLGLGKTVQYFYNKSDDIRESEFGYYDPRLFQTRWQLNAKEIERNVGNAREIKLDRPFYSADARWSGRLYHFDEEDEVKDFQNNVQISEFRKTSEISEFAAGTKLGHSRTVVNHAGLRYSRERERYGLTSQSNPAQPLPVAHDGQTIFVDLDTSKNHFVEMTRVEKMTRVEDVNLGHTLTVSPGFSPRSLTGRENSARLQSSLERTSQVFDGDLVRVSARYSGRDTYEKRTREKYEVAFRYYHLGLPRQTLVFNTRFHWSHKIQRDDRFEIGNENGVRAYERVAFVGTKAWVMNLEDRIFLFDEVADLVSIGGVVFYDAGYAWEQGRPVSVSDLRSNVGIGLRFGLTRSSNEVVLRMDLAYRMQRSGDDDPGFVFTFGSGQAF